MADYEHYSQRPPATANLPSAVGQMRQGGAPTSGPASEGDWDRQLEPADAGSGLPGGGDASTSSGFPTSGGRARTGGTAPGPRG